jgi:hypothetical protein
MTDRDCDAPGNPPTWHYYHEASTTVTPARKIAMVGPAAEPAARLRRRTVIVRPTHYLRPLTVLIAALLATSCASAASTEQAATVEPNSTRFKVYTHCGVESAHSDGRWWHASPPLYGKAWGPPARWSDPYQDGTLTLESAERAVFEALGQRVVFVPAPDNEPVRVCR